MADTRITPLEITRKFLAVFHSNCILAKNLNHDYEKNFGSQMGFDGQKIGPSVAHGRCSNRTSRKLTTP
jgi:hypothetical protein